ncbi:MAG: DUF3631 domain-containing protein [Planctomycetes bacterium]|nr:DUF3631 domain-containing protein [Planctomycetota bacterium]
MNANIVIEWRADGDAGRAKVYAMGDDGPLHSDVFKPASARSRELFIAALIAKCPALNTPERKAALEKELLTIVAKLDESADAKPDANAPEIELSRIVRPELFHTADVSGVAIAAVRIVGGKPRGSWELYCRWHAHGEREKRELESCVELPAGGSLWLHPIPADPTATVRAGWTPKARAAWLAGADAPDPVDVWKRVCERIAHFVEFPPDVGKGTVVTLALWTRLTYCYPGWLSVPYLATGGPMASGKTTLFGVLERLVFRPLKSSNMTAACLFRTLHECGGVLLLDEAERLRDNAPDAGELRSILLSGYKRGSPAIRLEKDGDTFRRVEFDVYGPKALAAISSLPEALASRSIRVGMFRAGADSPKPRRRLDANPALWSELRDDLHALALEHGATWLALADRADVCPTEIGGRDYELWQPLLALATWLEARGATGLTNVVSDFAAQTIDAGKDDSVPEADELLLRLVAEHVRDGTHVALKASDLLRQAREIDPATFGTAQAARWGPRGVGAALSRYGISTHKGTGNTGRTYARITLGQLRQIASAYGFDLGLPAENLPHVPQRTAGSEA